MKLKKTSRGWGAETKGPGLPRSSEIEQGSPLSEDPPAGLESPEKPR